MPRPKKKLDLPAAAVEFLAAQLAAISKKSHRAFLKRAEHLALTFRPCIRDVDLLPEGRIPFDAFRLFALSHRWVERRGRVTPMAVLGIYKPEIDLPGTGRISFPCEGAMSVGLCFGTIAPDPGTNATAARAAVLMAHAIEDVEHGDFQAGPSLPRFYYAFNARMRPVREPHITPDQWAAGETRIGDLWAWPAEFFARPAGRRWDVHPVDGSPDPWEGSDVPVGEGAIRGSWILRDKIATPRSQCPVAVFAELAGLEGRSVRNPAWLVLQRLGVIDPAQTYRCWLESTCPHSLDGRRLSSVDSPTAGSARFQADLAAWVDADAGNVVLLLDGLRDAYRAVGIPIPSGPEAATEFLLGLAETPWARVAVPGVARVQQIRLAGPPDPGTMVYSTGTVEVDLYDLGEHSARYEQVPAARVAEVFRQRYGRNKSYLVTTKPAC